MCERRQVTGGILADKLHPRSFFYHLEPELDSDGLDVCLAVRTLLALGVPVETQVPSLTQLCTLSFVTVSSVFQ